MKKCLEKILGESVDNVEVKEDKEFVNQHFISSGAVTRPGKIFISMSCDQSFGNDWPDFILHEYYHVVKQWAKGWGTSTTASIGGSGRRTRKTSAKETRSGSGTA